MKKIVLIIGMLCITFNTYSQVGIGTTTPTESLDVVGNIKTTTFSSIWKSNSSGGTYYSLDYIVIYNGVLYKNLTGTNTDTTPDMDAINWGRISTLTPNFLHGVVNSDEPVAAGQDLDFITVIASGGPLSSPSATSSGFFINLTAGLTYKLTASLNKAIGGTANYVVYQWHDFTNDVYLGNRAVTYSLDFSGKASSQTTAIAFFTPSVATQVHVEFISTGGGTATIDAEYGYITVEAL